MVERGSSFLIVIFCVALSLVLTFCLSSNTAKQGPKKGLVVVNVLDKELYNDCHITNSINIPFDQISRCSSEISRDAEIVVYCSNYQCSTSEYVASKLKEQGFCNVYVYQGGTAEWLQDGYPVIGPSKRGYLAKRIKKNSQAAGGGIPIISASLLAQKMGLHAKDMGNTAA